MRALSDLQTGRRRYLKGVPLVWRVKSNIDVGNLLRYNHRHLAGLAGEEEQRSMAEEGEELPR
jgi:hypothetical protein